MIRVGTRESYSGSLFLKGLGFKFINQIKRILNLLGQKSFGIEFNFKKFMIYQNLYNENLFKVLDLVVFNIKSNKVLD